MAEVLAVASSVAQLLDGAIRLLKRVRKAYDRHQNQSEVLDQASLELESINAIVQAIVDEDALQTPAVAAELNKICALGNKLVKCLKEIDPGKKGAARRIVHQFIHGSKEEEALADIMTDLDRAKATLSFRTQLANVGLTRMVHDTVVANVDVIDRIDRRLAEVFKERHGLKIAGLLNAPNLQETDDNLILLSRAEIASLEPRTNSNTELALDEKAIDRIIVGNMARGSAIQLLGPVGRDLWEDMRVRIENNTASGYAAQFAYPTDFATFKYLLDHQERMAVLEAR